MRKNRHGWQVVSSVSSPDQQFCVDVYALDGQFGFAVFRSDPEDGGRWTLLPGQGESGFSSAEAAARAASEGQVSKLFRLPELWITEVGEAASRLGPKDNVVGSVIDHYGQDQPIKVILAQLKRSGHDLNELGPDDLAGVDEFHLGGRLATVALLTSASLTSESRVLDVGCGIGGVARTVAQTMGCHVTGVDLTPVFVSTASELSELVGMSAATSFSVADASNLDFEDDYFDAVTLVHVGMNIEDKVGLFTELGRVVASHGTIHVYDIMRVSDGEITYPVPWSSDPATSFVERPQAYVAALTAAGLSCTPPVNRLDLVRLAVSKAKDQPPPVNLSHLMGSGWPTMFGNLSHALGDGIVAPVEIVARPNG